MSRLNSLRKDITEMTLDELRDHIRHIRADRKITKDRTVVKKARARGSDKAKTSAQKALEKMTPRELEALLRELEGDAGSGDQPSTD